MTTVRNNSHTKTTTQSQLSQLSHTPHQHYTKQHNQCFTPSLFQVSPHSALPRASNNRPTRKEYLFSDYSTASRRCLAQRMPTPVFKVPYSTNVFSTFQVSRHPIQVLTTPTCVVLVAEPIVSNGAQKTNPNS